MAYPDGLVALAPLNVFVAYPDGLVALAPLNVFSLASLVSLTQNLPGSRLVRSESQ